MDSNQIIEAIEYKEAILRREDTLLFDRYSHDDPLSLKEFIDKMFLGVIRNYDTITKSDNAFQCSENRARSTVDLYSIVLSYYPETKLIDLIEILYNLVDAGYINTYKCPDINRRVWFNPFASYTKHTNCNFTNSIRWWNYYHEHPAEKPDEFGMMPEDYVNFFSKKEEKVM